MAKRKTRVKEEVEEKVLIGHVSAKGVPLKVARNLASKLNEVIDHVNRLIGKE